MRKGDDVQRRKSGGTEIKHREEYSENGKWRKGMRRGIVVSKKRGTGRKVKEMRIWERKRVEENMGRGKEWKRILKEEKSGRVHYENDRYSSGFRT
ncbi:hypothetical protein Pmani_021370 [Petrolisthes manimaculis]|uniref:Uncharacterized protein n=1 Tax=Petrolisthes manimaculis TaxID=1843537 RepID=A0AAE1PFV1_9EUCA|nr:hypothetical protein Pmani_021370 [Petrolisthes manimaculis]